MTQGKQITPVGQICVALDKMEHSLNESLEHTGVSVSRFLSTAKTAIQTHSDKDRLARADRNSLYLAIKRSAGDGLMPDGREAALVVYGSTVQYQPMVQGLVKLARKSAEVADIGAYVVYEKDTFIFRAGVDQIPKHEANGEDNLGWFSANRGKPIGVWAFVRLKTGDYTKPTLLSKERVDRIAKRSKMAKNYDPNQGLDWEEFWCKAAIRNVLKYAPRSTAIEQALEADNGEFDLNQEDIYVNEEQPTEVKKETKAASTIKAKAKKEKVLKPEPHEDDVEDIIVEDVEFEDIDVEDIEIEDDDLPAM